MLLVIMHIGIGDQSLVALTLLLCALIGCCSLHHRPEAVATLEDITRLTQIMQEVHGMETELSKAGFHVNAKTIELKSALKRTLSSPAMMEVRFTYACLALMRHSTLVY